jgi:DNA (cytosine-5)-methyltransferase 1
MSLYQEILLLNNFHRKDQKFVIENVKPYYEPLIKPDFILQRHIFWSNFNVPKIEFNDNRKHMNITANSIVYDYDLSKYKHKNKRKLLRNMVNPEIGKYILDIAATNKIPEIDTQIRILI